ncbi:MAG: hypothetical protein RL164_1467 [Bacteroidota bacterium]
MSISTNFYSNCTNSKMKVFLPIAYNHSTSYHYSLNPIPNLVICFGTFDSRQFNIVDAIKIKMSLGEFQPCINCAKMLENIKQRRLDALNENRLKKESEM